MKILVTGTAGFIGNAIALRLLKEGHNILGIDNVNHYYDVRLKEARLNRLKDFDAFTELHVDIADRAAIEKAFKSFQPSKVVHMAAQAGVRYSIESPYSYIDSNLVGFANILEECRHQKVEHLVYASSSSVYGVNIKLPFSENDPTDHPLSLYGATKKANEVMAHSYSHLYQIPCTGLRFFTVYGPWGRPDMALFKFTKSILDNESIEIYNQGHHQRDFTYIDDVVEVVSKAISLTNQLAGSTLFNIGSGRQIQLMDMINIVESILGKKSIKKLLPHQEGDMMETYADISHASRVLGYAPKTSFEEGVHQFVQWFKSYYAF